MIGPQMSSSWQTWLPNLSVVTAKIVDEHGLVGLLHHGSLRELRIDCMSSATSDALEARGTACAACGAGRRALPGALHGALPRCAAPIAFCFACVQPLLAAPLTRPPAASRRSSPRWRR